jgi:hypothetical protein
MQLRGLLDYKHVRYVGNVMKDVRTTSFIGLFIFIFFSNATTCPLWTSWSPLPVVVEV